MTAPTIHERRAQIEAALEYAGGTHAFEDIVAGVAAGEMQFWPGPNSAVVTEVKQWPRKRCLHIFLAGGNLAEIEAMSHGILAWGRSIGCSDAVFIGRKGWERTFLTRDGWRQTLAVMEKEL